MDSGFYVVFFGTALFLSSFVSVFLLDRISFWRIKPGQITHESAPAT
jgi:hypothetical protein